MDRQRAFRQREQLVQGSRGENDSDGTKKVN